MFDIDRWQEIFASIRSNVLRTVLSGFTVALGLYIFIVLFGIGTGLQNAFTQGFTRDAQNFISIFSRETSIAYGGMQENRNIVFRNEDYQEVIGIDSEKVEYSTPRYYAFLPVKYERESGSYQINGVSSEEKNVKGRTLLNGRYINQGDLNRKNYVAVIGRMVQKDMIKNGNPIGKDISINGTMFKIIGVYADEKGGDWEERKIVVPISTLQQMKKSSDTISSIELTYNQDVISPKQAIAYGDEIAEKLKAKHRVSPEDENAIIVINNAKNTETSFQFLFVLTLIVGFIGLGTLLAGIIGISNIMVYIVKERTKEIGVRKAIGAKPYSIVGLIIQESLVITTISGAVGIVLGVVTLKMIGNSLEAYFIFNPSVSWGIILLAFVCLVFSGFIAGFVPAYRASRIKPIEALRAE